MSKPDETVKVVVRVRPMSSEEVRQGHGVYVASSEIKIEKILYLLIVSTFLKIAELQRLRPSEV